jgi:nitronate monooxygenase
MPRPDWRPLFDAPLPVIQAPMAGVQTHALAVAVGDAGGLGSLPAALLAPDALERELGALRAAGRPYNVNFFCHAPPVPDAATERRWHDTLRPYAREFGVDLDALPAGPQRAPFDHAVADLVEPFRPAVVSFHYGLPARSLLARVKGWGSIVWSTATTLDEARWLQAHGVDAVIAQGLEAGGHRGHFLDPDVGRHAGLRDLLPRLVQALDVPVIAAGGVGDGADVHAAFTLGATAVQCGTAFLLCDEAATGALHRAALQSDAARHTALTRLFTGRPARAIVNRLVRELGAAENLAPGFPLAAAALAPLRVAAERRGRDDFTPMWAGQNTRACRPVAAAAQVAALAGGTPLA